MTDIYISYSRRDVEMVSILARTLEESGYSVWWDVSGLHGGQSFAKVIQEKLSEAKCAIVVWSPDSVVSNWVHSEASLADKRGILVTAVYREADAPMPFNNRHNENLRGWNGDVFDDGFQKLVAAVHRLCPEPSGAVRSFEASGAATQVDTNKQFGTSKNGINTKTKVIGFGVLAVAIALGAYSLIPTKQDSQNSAQSLAVTPQAAVQTSATTEAKLAEQKRLASQAEAARVAEEKRLAEEVKAARKAEAARIAEAKRLAEKKRLEDEAKASTKIYKLPNKLTLLPIPAGDFMMGGEVYKSEKPVHNVTFEKPFWMSKTEITFDQYDAYVKATGKNLPDDEKWGRGTQPVINVSWNDTQGYLKWLSDNNEQGLQCRLPSEAEWEYAARAGSKTKYFWGDEIGKNKANCNGCGSQWDGEKTAPVGSFPDNQWGLQEMHGNVWEWVEDSWHKDYTGAPDNGAVWEKDGDASRVLRGGSWYLAPGDLRSADRNSGSPGYRINSIGFRVVCSPPSVR